MSDAAAAAAKKQDDEEYQRKRAEVMRKVAEARAAQEKAAAAKAKKFQAAPEARKFGTHTSITCDGCAVQPIIGYRWRCRICKNHDLCDACYDTFKNEGKLLHVNGRRNPISLIPDRHEFYALAEQGCFKGMNGNGETAAKATKKIKPNEPCPCGSGKKFKKCCRA